ncbi:MAG: hypothetical protein ACXVLQ_18670 [Bacteriovorax sp.]
MKYALCFFVLAFTAKASTIHSFSDSQALMTIAQFMVDSASDTPTSSRISDEKLNLKDTSKCVDVSSAIVIKEVESAIKNVFHFYPDEELPIEEALADLSDYLKKKTYKECTLYQKSDLLLIKTLYFFDSEDKKHIKVDTITLHDL